MDKPGGLFHTSYAKKMKISVHEQANYPSCSVRSPHGHLLVTLLSVVFLALYLSGVIFNYEHKNEKNESWVSIAVLCNR